MIILNFFIVFINEAYTLARLRNVEDPFSFKAFMKHILGNLGAHFVITKPVSKSRKNDDDMIQLISIQ